MQDNNLSFTQLFAQRFETIRNVSKNRKPTVKPLLVNSSLRNPKHAAILSECGINYDSPLSPLEVAANRAKRIQNERNALLVCISLLLVFKDSVVKIPIMSKPTFILPSV